MKKIIATFCLIASLYATQAQANKPFEGPYIGASLGYLMSTSHAEGINYIGNGQSSFKMGGHAPHFSLFAGYGGFVWQKLYLGCEAMFSYTTYKGKYVNDHTESKFTEHHIQDSYGLAIRAGWNIKDVALIYIKGGIASSAMRLKTNEFDSGENVQKRPMGFVMGFGVDFMATDNLVLGAEFIHTRYQSIHVTVDKAAYYHYKLEPQTSHVALRAAWKF